MAMKINNENNGISISIMAISIMAKIMANGNNQ
jgi:hypothetical protein